MAEITDVGSQLFNSREKFLGYVRKRIADPDFAEDILQDCLLKAVRGAPQVKDEQNVVRWFYRILQNAIVDAYRRKAAEANRRSNYAAVAEQAAEQEDENTRCECVNDLIPTLRPEYAEVAKSIDLQGEDPGAAAKRLGITRNNLKVRTHRARQALRKRLEETCKDCAADHCMDCSCGTRYQ